MSDEAQKPKKPKPRPMKPAIEADDDLITVQDVLNKTGWSYSTLDRRIAAGEYPQPAEGKSGQDRRWFRKQHRRWAERRMAAVDKVA